MYSAYETLAQELDKTIVLSDKFKAFILSWTLEVASQAYQKGGDDLWKRLEDEGRV